MHRRTMIKYVIPLAAGALLLAGCSSGEAVAPAPTAASPSDNLAAAIKSKEMGQELGRMVRGGAAETCADLKADPTAKAYRTRTHQMNIAVALVPSSGQAKDVNVWATDQQIHAYCPEYSSFTSYPPAWDSGQ